MKVTIAQLNPLVGDIDGNASKLMETLSRESQAGADLVVFPELFLVGYPPQDLLERPWFIEKTQRAIRDVAQFSARHPGTGLIFGAPMPTGVEVGKRLYNSAVLVHQGKVIFVQHKSLLPTYDVFDELRYFSPAPEIRTVDFKGETLGLSICEDAWNDRELWPMGGLYALDPIKALADKGASLLINISASPFFMDKEEIRFRLIRNHARRHQRPFLFVNQVGGNDELVFDGCSCAISPDGTLLGRAASFAEDLLVIDTSGPAGRCEELGDPLAALSAALKLGLRDYIGKCGFKTVVLGLSGGIDSAVVAVLAADAIGSQNVHAVAMPSRYSSPGSLTDAEQLAANLKIHYQVVPIRHGLRTVISAYLGVDERRPAEASALAAMASRVRW